MFDSTLVSRADGALKRSTYSAVRRLIVEGADGKLVLLGNVGTYFLKQVAQETVLLVCQGTPLVNRVVVDAPVASQVT